MNALFLVRMLCQEMLLRSCPVCFVDQMRGLKLSLLSGTYMKL